MPAQLQIEQLSLSFGGIQALRSVSLEVQAGELFAIMGPNGAGKTSLINCINGFYKPQAGRIVFDGRDITSMPPYKRARLGLSRTFQNIALYANATVLDNLMAARHIHMRTSLLQGALFWGPAQREEIAHRRRVEEIIEFLRLERIRKSVVGTLSYGLRKRVELARALALEPTLLLLDEPMAGMNVEEKEDMARYILDIHELQGRTIVLIEHDIGLVMDLSQRIAVINFGCLISIGSPAEISRDEAVISAYLGAEQGAYA